MLFFLAFSIPPLFFRKKPGICGGKRHKLCLRKEKADFPQKTGVLSKNQNKERVQMSSNNNKLNVPQAKQAMEQFKMQAASEVGVNLQNGYNGNLTSREAGSVGGQMVKKMIEAYESGMQ